MQALTSSSGHPAQFERSDGRNQRRTTFGS